jgi:hypothetical protein
MYAVASRCFVGRLLRRTAPSPCKLVTVSGVRLDDRRQPVSIDHHRVFTLLPLVQTNLIGETTCKQF